MIFAITPAVGWAIPLLWPALLSAAGALGYKLYTSTAEDAPLRGKLTKELMHSRIVKLPLDQVVKDLVSEEVGREQVLRFVKDKITVVFKRDIRGKFTIEVMGPDTYSTRELENMGTEFAGTLVQQFAYNRMATELERKGANVVNEEITENGDIVLKLRRWD